MDIYIDESGDIGLGTRSSDYFVIAAVVVRDPLCVRRCFSRVRKSRLKKRFREVPEFKFNNTSGTLKRRILECLARCDLDIVYSVLRKKELYPELRDKPYIVYNYLMGSLIAHMVSYYGAQGEVNIIVDKSMSGIQRDAFDQYIVYKIFEKNPPEELRNTPLKVRHLDSRSEPCIQAADFVAGAIHRLYRTGDNSCYRLVEKNIVRRFDYFNGPQK
jgi:hypothetical protein